MWHKSNMIWFSCLGSAPVSTTHRCLTLDQCPNLAVPQDFHLLMRMIIIIVCLKGCVRIEQRHKKLLGRYYLVGSKGSLTPTEPVEQYRHDLLILFSLSQNVEFSMQI